MAKTTTRRPTHPGVLFKRQYLDAMGIDIKTAAEEYLGVSRATLSNFVNGKSGCTREMASRLSQATGTGVAVWVNLQARLDTWTAEQQKSTIRKKFDETEGKRCA